MARIEFFIAMEPPTATAQEREVVVRDGRPAFYEPPKVRAARSALTAHLAGRAPKEPMRGPLELLAKWLFPPRGRDLKAAGADRGWHRWRDTRPDTDNLDKLLKDCMTRAGFWRDDAQVCREIIEKHWAAVPGIYVRVTELEE